jgi:hypothetical protein
MLERSVQRDRRACAPSKQKELGADGGSWCGFSRQPRDFADHAIGASCSVPFSTAEDLDGDDLGRASNVSAPDYGRGSVAGNGLAGR